MAKARPRELGESTQYVAEELEGAYEKVGRLADAYLDAGDYEWAGRTYLLHAKMAELLNEWCGYEAF